MINRTDAFDQELQRSRRYGRPLSLVRVRSRSGNTSELVAALEARTREVDHLWTVGPDVVVLLPEADVAAARAFVDRACGPLIGTLAWDTATASFPDDGLTRPALVAALDGDGSDRVEAPPVPEPPEPVLLPRILPAAGRRLAVPVGASAGPRRLGRGRADDRPSRKVG